MNNRIYRTLLLVVAIFLLSNCAIWARGGGGSRGGGFRGADDFGRDSGYRDDGYRGDPGGDFDRARSDVNPDSMGTHAAATQNYNHGAETPIASDGGFNRLAEGNKYPGNVTNRVDPANLQSRAETVRANYGYGDIYNRGFWAAHPEAAWADASRWGDDWAWGNAGWPTLAGWWDMPVGVMPIDYDYGNNITYQNDNVYYGSKPVETAAAYYDQAQDLAESMPVSSAEASMKSDWKTLGVFSMVQGDQTNTTSMFQLAVNKKGAIKGSYYNPLTSETKPVSGGIDKKNMRASWIVGQDKNVVYDTGLSNLLKQQSQILVHYGKDKTQQWTLVRLEKNRATHKSMPM